MLRKIFTWILVLAAVILFLLRDVKLSDIQIERYIVPMTIFCLFVIFRFFYWIARGK